MVSSVSPGTYSITMKKTPSCFSAVVIATMLGCETLASSRGSRSRSPKSRFWRCGTLIATCLSIQVSRARYTVPNPPLPSGERILYLPRICPWNSIRLQYTAQPMSLPRFHCTPIDPTPGTKAVLTDAEARHARQILRMRPGDRAELFDGAGVEVIAEVVGPEAQTLAMRVLEARTAATELPIRVVIAPAVLKGDAMDALVRDVSMLGAHAIAPVVTTRTVV